MDLLVILDEAVAVLKAPLTAEMRSSPKCEVPADPGYFGVKRYDSRVGLTDPAPQVSHRSLYGSTGEEPARSAQPAPCPVLPRFEPYSQRRSSESELSRVARRAVLWPRRLAVAMLPSSLQEQRGPRGPESHALEAVWT